MLAAENRKQFSEMIHANAGALLSVNTTNELINLGGNLGMRYTLILVPLGVFAFFPESRKRGDQH
jgi:hypothetical protein